MSSNSIDRTSIIRNLLVLNERLFLYEERKEAIKEKNLNGSFLITTVTTLDYFNGTEIKKERQKLCHIQL